MDRIRIDGHVYRGEFEIRREGGGYVGAGAIRQLDNIAQIFIFHPNGEYRDSIVVLDAEVLEKTQRVEITRDELGINDVALEEMYNSARCSRAIIPQVNIPVLSFERLQRARAVWLSELC